MVAKVPPPPFLTGQFQQLNRWLLEIQNVLNSGGLIEQGQVDGLPAALAAINAAIAALQLNLTTDVTVLQNQITANNTNIAALQIQVAALQANAVVRNGSGVPSNSLGNDGDLYVNFTGALFAGGIANTSSLFARAAGVWTGLV